MNRFSTLLLAVLTGAFASECRGIEIQLSVKFILSSAGARPVTVAGAGNIDLSSATAFNEEVVHGNRVFAESGRGFRLRVVEYLDIRPPAPAGKDADYWYTIETREERQAIESAATFNKGSKETWQWNDSGVINIYINNSTSGSCSFIGSGNSISLGATIFTRGTVLHEIGHFFGLQHTHSGDPDSNGWVAPNPLSDGISNGDGLTETLRDHPFYTRDQLSQANFGPVYADLDAAQRAAIDITWNNLMSYHEENQLIGVQMDTWAEHGNNSRRFYTLGSTRFVAPGGADQAERGLVRAQPLATFSFALSTVNNERDVILLRSGFYQSSVREISTKCIIAGTGGPVVINQPAP